MVVPLDVSDGAAIRLAHDRITQEWGPVERLILAAGLNSPRRAWADQSLDDFEAIVSTNLTGVVRVIQEALPSMRAAHDGVIVIISSYAGWRLSSSPGVAYSASKVALSAVATTLNGQEAGNGIRTTHLCPGDVNTDFLLMRPSVPEEQARAQMLTAQDIARCVKFVIDSPSHVVIDELVVSPTSQSR
jgi:NADP-dependent 3-hydroxy acid dehydrogenase YdfG